MLVNIAQHFIEQGRTWLVGESVDVPTEVAQRWIADGKATADADGRRDQSSVPGDGGAVGPYADTTALQAAYPAASNAGRSALVGASAPYSVYVSNGSAWAASGVFANVQDVRLASDFSTNLFAGTSAGAANTPLSTTQGRQNTFLGAQAGASNTTGYANLAVGFAAATATTTGSGITAVGYQAGNLSNASFSTYLGTDAGSGNNANNNTFIGWHSGYGGAGVVNVTGSLNTFVGHQTCQAGTTMSECTAVGANSGLNITTGYSNTLLGSASGIALTTGYQNTVIGAEACKNLSTGTNNAYFGYRAGFNAGGSTYNNTGIGNLSLFGLTTGFLNTAVGSGSGQSITTGTNNTFVGYNCGNNASQLVSASNSTAIGNTAFTTKSNQVVIGNASVTETVLRGRVVLGSLATPASATATGVAGTVMIDADYLYACVATDTWKRVALATW